MRTAWTDAEGRERAVIAPVSLIVSAFAPLGDVRPTLTPAVGRWTAATPCWCCSTRRGGRRRLGGSALAQVYGQLGDEVPDVLPGALAALFRVVGEARAAGSLLAYHDVGDGGLFATLAEMAFASRCGLDITLDAIDAPPLAALFAEEIGAVVQVPVGAREAAARSRPRRGPRRRDRRHADGERTHHRPDGGGGAARPGARRSPPRVVRHHPRAAAPARPSAVRRRGIRPPARRGSRASGEAHVRSDRGHRGALHRHRRAAADRDPARAGRQRPGRDGRGVRPRRFRRRRRAHERHHRGPPLARRLPGLRGLRRFLLRRRAGRGRRLGEVHPVQPARARRVRGVLRPPGHLRAGRVQRLPDDEQPARADSRRGRTGRTSCATAPSSSRRAS